MTKIIKNARIILKTSDQANDSPPSIPSNDDHTSGQWTKYDLYVSELYLNSADDKLWIRTTNGIKPVILNDGLGITNSVPMFKNENVLTKSIITQDTTSRISVAGDINFTGTLYKNNLPFESGSASGISYLAPFTTGYIPVISANKSLTNSKISYDFSGMTVIDGYIDTNVGYRLNGLPLTVTSSDVTYDNAAYPILTNVKLALDQILYTPPTASLSINATGNSLSGTLAEKGSTINTLVLHWSVNKTMVTINLSGYGGFSTTGNTTLLSDNVNVDILPTSNASYSISAIDSYPNTANGSASLTFTQKVYYGTSAIVNFTTSADIMSLSSSLLSTIRTRSFTIANGNGEYIYYCYPTSYGTASFTIGGFGVGMIVTTISYTNNYGVTENYYVCKNSVISNGSNINVVVS